MALGVYTVHYIFGALTQNQLSAMAAPTSHS